MCESRMCFLSLFTARERNVEAVLTFACAREKTTYVPTTDSTGTRAAFFDELSSLPTSSELNRTKGTTRVYSHIINERLNTQRRVKKGSSLSEGLSLVEKGGVIFQSSENRIRGVQPRGEVSSREIEHGQRRLGRRHAHRMSPFTFVDRRNCFVDIRTRRRTRRDMNGTRARI